MLDFCRVRAATTPTLTFQEGSMAISQPTQRGGRVGNEDLSPLRRSYLSGRFTLNRLAFLLGSGRSIPESQVRCVQVELTIPHPGDFRPMQDVCSRSAGPRSKPRLLLRVYPAGKELQTGALSAFVGFTFPHDCRVLKDVTYKIVLLNKTEANWKRVGGTSSFYRSPASGSGQFKEWGAPALIKVSDMLLPEAGWLNDQGELQFRATATITLEASAPCPAFCAQLDLSQDLAPVTFHLPDGPPLIFDKRLLVARSEYFKEMLSEDK